jgi:membrane-bound lytic murein transglycosylase D
MPTSSSAWRPARVRSPHALSALCGLLLLSACAGTAAPVGPAPVSMPEPELLGESPEIVEREVREPARDILGTVAYDLPVEANSWVEAELDFLIRERRSTLQRWLERGDAYEAYIKRILEEERVPTDLYHVAMIESGFVTTARSRAGAVGFWQFMPVTGRSMGLRVDSLVDERMDPIRSTRAAARHLRDLHRIYGDWALAAAAYNAGSGRISRAMRAFGATDFWDLAQRGDLAAETKHYVPRLFAVTVIGRDRERFGFTPAPTPGTFAYDSMLVEYATPLEELASLGAPSVEQLARHNPHLFRGATPNGPYWVWLPPETGVEMQRAWLASDFRRQGGMGIYVVRSGDTLGHLAQFSGISSARIRELNPRVNFDRLRIGESLRFPFQAAAGLTARPSRAPVVAAVAPAEPTESPRSGPATTRTAAAGAGTHTVRDGETLWGIARQHGVSVAVLQEENGLDGATIRPGQALRIPGTTATATAVAAESVAEPRVHVVESGESLWSIARRYGTSVDAIRSANDLADRPIQPGQRLNVPAEVASGEAGR